ncbi:hypothetical protein AVEN_239845-1 [Araneus ventricosus]|uniref:Uncharacterized protein n=1 Tax=Araneus ventricosus TaxID=182803 RepID=A0A4Y2LGB0_ARAVE|nr:hypothetical protein AVEN_239845-1 [Araneus ventricosus]
MTPRYCYRINKNEKNSDCSYNSRHGSFNRTSSGGYKRRHFRPLDIWRKWTADSHRTGSTPKEQPLLLGALTSDLSRSQSQWENGEDAGCSTDQVGMDELCRVSSVGKP